VFIQPGIPNLTDFNTYVLNQGVPASDIPSGALSGVSIDTSGNLVAAGSTGTVTAGMILSGSGIAPDTYLTAWTQASLTGTVFPVPLVALSGLSLSASTAQVSWAFDYAVNRVMTGGSSMPGSVYTLAVYNLGMHQLLKIGQDITPSTFFSGARQQYGITSFVGGVISATADQNSSNAIAVPEAFKNLGFSNLDALKTPWGREYLAYAQEYGPYVVGVS